MVDKVPFIDLTRSYNRYKDELEKAACRVLSSGVYLNGRETEALERELSSFLGVEYAIGVSSGTEALYLILKALDLPKDSIVLLPSFTFVATAEVIVRAGLRPFFVDVEPHTPNLSVDNLVESYKALKAEGKNVSAVIAVSIFGIPGKLFEISEFCIKENLYLIEDICQAFGSKIGEKRIGTFGIASATSFYPTKSLSGFGDAGMVFTNNKELYEKIKRLKEHGQSKAYFYIYHGVNGRIDEIQCALLRVKFKYFEEEVKLRKEIVEYYLKELSAFPIYTFKIPPSYEPVYSIFSIRYKERDKLKSFLDEKKIESKIYYPLALHLQPIYKDLGFREGDLPETEKLCREILSLPLFPYLTFEEINYVVNSIKEFFEVEK